MSLQNWMTFILLWSTKEDILSFGYHWLWTKNTANYLLSDNNTKLTFSEWVCMCPDAISDTFLCVWLVYFSGYWNRLCSLGTFETKSLAQMCMHSGFFFLLFKIKTDAKIHSHRELFSFSSMGVLGIVPQGAKHNTVSKIPHLAWRD